MHELFRFSYSISARRTHIDSRLFANISNGPQAPGTAPQRSEIVTANMTLSRSSSEALSHKSIKSSSRRFRLTSLNPFIHRGYARIPPQDSTGEKSSTAQDSVDLAYANGLSGSTTHESVEKHQKNLSRLNRFGNFLSRTLGPVQGPQPPVYENGPELYMFWYC